jgi:thiosulfate dehydrogenase [quinone] large subunit
VISRAEVVLGGIVALALVVLGLAPRGGISSTVATRPGGAATSPPGTGQGNSGQGKPTTGQGQASGVPAGYKKIGNISQLPTNSAGLTTDPKSGDPAIIVHTAGSDFYAYDAVCTHAGCTVQYDPQSKLIVCPCHGGAFDPTKGAEVVSGPPPSPLTPLPMKIDTAGNIYLA